MTGSKEYFLKLREEQYHELENSEKMYLFSLGMVVKQMPKEIDLEDENVKKLNKDIAKAYEEREKYLFKKRNK